MADLAQAQALGFSSGRGMGADNISGTAMFVRNFLKERRSEIDRQRTQQSEQQVAQQAQQDKLGQIQATGEQARLTQAEKPAKRLSPKERAMEALETDNLIPGLNREQHEKMVVGGPTLLDYIFGNQGNGDNVDVPADGGKPKFNPKTQKLQRNSKGEYRVVPK